MAKNIKILDKLEQTPGQIKIEKDQPLLKQNIGLLEYALLPLEFWALKTAFRNKNPMSTGEYYNLSLTQKFTMSKLTLPSSLHGPITADVLRVQESKLREHKIKFPSYKKVLSTLQSLEAYGLLVSRAEKNKKANAYWYINPEFLLKYGDAFNKKYHIDKLEQLVPLPKLQ